MEGTCETVPSRVFHEARVGGILLTLTLGRRSSPGPTNLSEGASASPAGFWRENERGCSRGVPEAPQPLTQFTTQDSSRGKLLLKENPDEPVGT